MKLEAAENPHPDHRGQSELPRPGLRPFEQRRVTRLGPYALWAFGCEGSSWYAVQFRCGQGHWVTLMDETTTYEDQPGLRASAALASAEAQGLAWLWGVLRLGQEHLADLLAGLPPSPSTSAQPEVRPHGPENAPALPIHPTR